MNKLYKRYIFLYFAISNRDGAKHNVQYESPINSYRAKILGLLLEGNSLRFCNRLADVSINTVTKLLIDVGAACAKYHDEHVRNVRVRRLQCDEIWCFVGAKAKNVRPEKEVEGWGGCLDVDGNRRGHKTLRQLVGGRDGGWAMDFMQDCASRIRGRVQITTDGHRAYLARGVNFKRRHYPVDSIN